jgi:hypothetical protein
VSDQDVAAKAPDAQPGFQKKTLIYIGLGTAAVWGFAINTGSLWFMIVVGVLTVLLAGFLFWAWRMLRRQKGLADMLRGAQSSPEARKAAIARLEQEKDAGDVTNVFARAQLVMADDAAKALEMLEGIEMKKVPPQIQDDVAILTAQLYLHFGRPKDARPLVDKVNLDAPSRAEMRGMMAAIVAESWARTGRAEDAITLLDSVDFENQKEAQVTFGLYVARVFARFAAGKKGGAREDLNLIASRDVNQLGRFLMPQFKVHPDLQKLARSVAEKNPQVQKMQRAQQPRQRMR